MKPYWVSDDGAITVYHADYLDVLAAGCVPVREVALVHDDPPYGIDVDLDGGISTRLSHTHHAADAGRRAAKLLAPHSTVGRRSARSGEGSKGSASPTTLPSAFPFAALRCLWPADDRSDGEMAWTNIGGSARIFRHYWKGALRATERGDTLHPTQKPIALCSWGYARAKLKRGDLVFVPHGGSGPDLPACRAAGLRLIWIEIERAYCDTAIARLGAITTERAAEPAGPLFAR